ncbi:DoxX family protein [Actinophytocola sp. KF-1]
MILRRIARPMLAAVFVSGGINTLRNPKPRLETAGPAVDKATHQVLEKIPDQALDKVPDKVVDKIPTDAESLVKINAAAQVGAGLMLGLGRFPRLAALVLASSTIPTTLAGHAFWDKTDPAERAHQQVQFLKNMGLVGGLLLAAADTHGKPSAAWRAKRAARTAANTVQGAASAVLPG